MKNISVEQDENGTEAFISNGKDGEDGLQGEAGPQGETGLQGEIGPQGDDGPLSITEALIPCPEIDRPYPEVLLILANGQILVSFSASVNGNNTRLVLLPPSNYIATDGSGCVFTVGSDGEVSW